MVNIQEAEGVQLWTADDKQEKCTVVFLTVGKNQIEPLIFATEVSKATRRSVISKRVIEIMEQVHKAQEQVGAKVPELKPVP